MTDMQGRLQGKRLTATHFLDEVVEHDAEGCNYLLAVDVEMNTVRGLRDVLLGARLRRLRLQAGHGYLEIRSLAGGTALVTCDLVWEDGSPVVASPRQVLKRQLGGSPNAAWKPS